MPRYYCDYCDTYLTHDSPSVRKQHNAGYKHKANVRSYYQKFEEQQTQALIDQRIKERLGQAAAYQQIGAAYNQHLAAFPGQPPRMPILPPPLLPIPGAPPPQLVPGVRPPILPRPLLPGVPAYSVPPPVPGQPPGAPPLPMQPGMPNPNSAPPVPGGVAPTSSSSAPTAAVQSMYQPNPAVSAAPATNTPASSYTFAPPPAPAPAPAPAPETSH